MAKKFIVSVGRTRYYSSSIEVEADNEQEAMEIAECEYEATDDDDNDWGEAEAFDCEEIKEEDSDKVELDSAAGRVV